MFVTGSKNPGVKITKLKANADWLEARIFVGVNKTPTNQNIAVKAINDYK